MTQQDDFVSFGSGQQGGEAQPQQPPPTGSGEGFSTADFGGSGTAGPTAGWSETTIPGGTGGGFSGGVPTEADLQKDNFAIASTVVGVLSLCLAVLPICGLPASVAAVGLGAYSLKAPNRRTLAIAGIVLGAIAALLSLCSAGFGLYSYLSQTY